MLQNTIHFPTTMCYMQGIQRKRENIRESEYFVFFLPWDVKSYQVGLTFSKQYATAGRRYMRSKRPLRFLLVPYTGATLQEPDELKEYMKDFHTLLGLIDKLKVSEKEKKEFKWALYTLYFAFDKDQVPGFKAFAKYSVAGNPDYAIDKCICRINKLLPKDEQIQGWARFVSAEDMSPLYPGTEVMICGKFTDLLEDCACDLSKLLLKKAKATKKESQKVDLPTVDYTQLKV